ncbi:uncharacterized protein LOC113272324 [Papaver somniferum]|uniref:uncharacterized protein LOC113272324 n=1 Tax=Papaver somniferum TaxID=3469 RepID=UPI000E703FFA|nr:uncharacterized protein LOC113272324 [Papaver somniferum]
MQKSTLKKGLKSQQSQPDNASPSKSASLASKCRTPRKNKSAEPTDPISPTDANTCQRRSSPRFKEAAELTNPKSTTHSTPPSSAQPETEQPTPYTRKKLVSKTKNVLTPTKSKEDAANSKCKTVKRKLDTSTGPCPTIQLRNPTDTFSDFEEEEDDEILHTNQDVQEEESDVDSDEGKDNDDGDETGVGKELENDDKPEDEVVGPRKRRKFVPRGPTQMHAMRLDSTDPKAKVPFNFKDQPTGDPSVQLASCLGVLVRRNIPLTYKDWRIFPPQAKANIWKIVEQRFIVPEHYQDYYFAKMGAYLKESRSRKAGLVLEALDQLQEEEREKRLAKLIPTSMSVNEWETFVKRVGSHEFRVKRIRMQEICSKHNTPHTIGREGYARLEVKMQKKCN